MIMFHVNFQGCFSSGIHFLRGLPELCWMTLRAAAPRAEGAITGLDHSSGVKSMSAFLQVVRVSPNGCFQNRGTPKWMVYNGKLY